MMKMEKRYLRADLQDLYIQDSYTQIILRSLLIGALIPEHMELKAPPQRRATVKKAMDTQWYCQFTMHGLLSELRVQLNRVSVHTSVLIS